MINVAVFGYGTIGSGVVQVIDDNNKLIAERLGEQLNVKYILDIRDFPGDRNERKVVHDINTILDDPEVSIVCETMVGDRPAYQYTKDALLKGKSVCTSNKVVVANHAPELLKIARENGCNYLFEASVGGGIPIIRPMNTSLAPEHIDKIMGILNGTTNYMLTKMSDVGASYDDVLKEAQDLGYAERNPEADVEGHDPCRKIAILSSLMIGKNVNYEEIYTEGITKITPKDFEYAKKLGKSIKLLAIADNTGKELNAIVAPFMIGSNHPLNGVNGVFNGVYVTGNMLDDVMFYGSGAGKLPTASAVVSDVIECARNLDKALPCVWSDEPVKLGDFKTVKRQFFVRVAMENRGEVLNQVGPINEIRICDEEFGFVTAPMTENDFDAKMSKLSGVLSVIRVEG